MAAAVACGRFSYLGPKCKQLQIALQKTLVISRFLTAAAEG